MPSVACMLSLDSSSRREVMIRTTLLCVLGVCFTLGFSRADSQTPTARSAAWDQKAAATYLDDRAIWWKNWSVSDRDHDTSCASCHTTVPYALARPALRAALGALCEAAGGDRRSGDLAGGLLSRLSSRLRLPTQLICPN